MKTLVSILKSRHLWGLSGTGAVLFFLVYVVFGKTDVSWIMPPTDQIAAAIIDVWPKMPFFVQSRPVEGQPGMREILYTVPTHQLTRAEMERLGITNAVTHPAVPKKSP